MSAGVTPGPHWVEGSIYDGFAASIAGRVEAPGNADRETKTLAFVRTLGDACLFAAAADLLEQAKLFVRTIDYQVKKDTAAGDDEGARLKTATRNIVQAVIDKAEGRA